MQFHGCSIYYQLFNVSLPRVNFAIQRCLLAFFGGTPTGGTSPVIVRVYEYGGAIKFGQVLVRVSLYSLFFFSLSLSLLSLFFSLSLSLSLVRCVDAKVSTISTQ